LLLSGLYAQLGDVTAAVEELRRLSRYPHRFYRIVLTHHWYWESVRGDPRFQAFVAGL
jgi:hypothetical protein